MSSRPIVKCRSFVCVLYESIYYRTAFSWPTRLGSGGIDITPIDVIFIVIYDAPPLVMLYSIVPKYQGLRRGIISGYTTTSF